MAYGKTIPGYIKPMLATAVDKPFNSDEWLKIKNHKSQEAIIKKSKDVRRKTETPAPTKEVVK